MGWCLNIIEAFFENLRTEGYMQTCVIFYGMPTAEVYNTLSGTRNIGLSKKYNENLPA